MIHCGPACGRKKRGDERERGEKEMRRERDEESGRESGWWWTVNSLVKLLRAGPARPGDQKALSVLVLYVNGCVVQRPIDMPRPMQLNQKKNI